MGPHVFSNKWILPLRFTKPLFIVDWKRETGMYSLQVSLPCECNRRHSFVTDVAFLQHCSLRCSLARTEGTNTFTCESVMSLVERSMPFQSTECFQMCYLQFHVSAHSLAHLLQLTYRKCSWSFEIWISFTALSSYSQWDVCETVVLPRSRESMDYSGYTRTKINIVVDIV
jgi:hypothetical protein